MPKKTERKDFVPLLTPLRGEAKLSPVIAFDTETYGQENDFQIGVVSTPQQDYLFEDPTELLDFICRKEWWNYNVFATNLAFDAFACFQASVGPGKMPEGWSFFDNGAKLIWVKKIVSKEYRTSGEIKHRYQTLLDSLNIFPAGVEEMGNILLRVSADYERKGDTEKADYFREIKLQKPKWLGKKKWANLNEADKRHLSTYCAADARVTRKFMEWFGAEVIALGGELKMTAASTSMDLFRRKYLREANIVIPQPSFECMVDSRFSYYGGRTEDFARGVIDSVWDADVTAMYPSSMVETDFPYPSPERFIKWTSPPSSCLSYEGFSKVAITVPYMHIPPLPFKSDGKLLFPYGTLQGVWTNLEIRYALSLGSKIEEIEWSYFNQKTFNPFKSYVLDLMEKRLGYAYPASCPADCNCRGRITGRKCKAAMATEEVVKLFMNSLYGKFAQNFLTQDQADALGIAIKKSGGTFKQIGDATLEEIEYTGIHFPEYLAKGYVINKAIPKVKLFMNPILSSYVTARARIKLHSFILQAIKEGAEVEYTDTDSLYYSGVKKPLSFCVPNKQLGLLQTGKNYKQMLIFNPKTKRLLTHEGKIIKTAKGIPGKSFLTDFSKLRDGMSDEELDSITEELDPREEFFQSLKSSDPKEQGKTRMSRFLKFKEAMARGEAPNKIMPITKKANPDVFPKRRIIGNPTFNDLWERKYRTTPWEIDAKTQLVIEV